MCCSSNIQASTKPSCYETVGHVALGIGLVAAVIAAIAVLAIFAPAVGLFILGASFTAALAMKVGIGTGAVALLLCTTAASLYCLHGKKRELTPTERLANLLSSQEPENLSEPVTESNDHERDLENNLKDYIHWYARSWEVFDCAFDHPELQPETAASWSVAKGYPALVKFKEGSVSYTFNQPRTNNHVELKVEILYQKNPKGIFVTVWSDKFEDKFQRMVVEELRTLMPQMQVILRQS